MLAELQKALVVNQKIQLTVWDPDNAEREFHYHSFVMDVALPLFRVAPPLRNLREIEALLTPGLVVGALLEAYPAPFLFYPLIDAVQPASASIHWLKLPPQPKVEVMKARRHVRIPMVIPLKAEFMVGGKWRSVEGHTEDMSGGGLRFTSAQLFCKGQELLVHLRVDDGKELLKLKGTVVYAAENRIRRHRDDIYATAVQFVDLEAKQEALIMRECFRRELRKPV